MKEIFDCVQMLKLQTVLEVDKAYCRDYWQRGRIRVRLFNENENENEKPVPISDDIPTRTLFLF